MGGKRLGHLCLIVYPYLSTHRGNGGSSAIVMHQPGIRSVQILIHGIKVLVITALVWARPWGGRCLGSRRSQLLEVLRAASVVVLAGGLGMGDACAHPERTIDPGPHSYSFSADG